jgi:hypothetical protein
MDENEVGLSSAGRYFRALASLSFMCNNIWFGFSFSYKLTYILRELSPS